MSDMWGDDDPGDCCQCAACRIPVSLFGRSVVVVPDGVMGGTVTFGDFSHYITWIFREKNPNE